MKNRFQKGDVIHIVKYWDQSDYVWLEGILLIDDYIPHYPSTLNGIYKIKQLKGNLRFYAINSEHFDNLEYLVWLGNINDNKSLRLLYAS